MRADWNAGLADALGPASFDLILSNPPYIPSREVAQLQPEVAQFDPPAALDGGSDGLAAYRVLAPQLAALLAVEGRAVVEIGQTQAAAVSGLLAAAGLRVETIRRDLAGLDRCLVAHREGKR